MAAKVVTAGRKYPKHGPQVSQWSTNADCRRWMAIKILNLREGKEVGRPRGTDQRWLISSKEDISLAKAVVARHERRMRDIAAKAR
ncbi:MAG: hypothetical protein ACOYB2_11080 [Limnohabitans sp.]